MERKTAVVEYLRSLGDKELAEIFYEATRDRTTSDATEENGHLVLADAVLEGGTWSIEVIAVADVAQYETQWAVGSPICQSGVCEACGTRLRSWAKHMVCPVCGHGAYGT